MTKDNSDEVVGIIDMGGILKAVVSGEFNYKQEVAILIFRLNLSNIIY